MDDAFILSSPGFEEKWTVSGEARRRTSPYLNPRLLFQVAFVSFTFTAFATVLLILTHALHVAFIVVAPVR